MAQTKIQWSEMTWNPVTGCRKVSPGCKNCYSEAIAKRFWGDRKFTDVRLHDDRLGHPFRWKKPRRVFVNSMSDLFHPDVPVEFIDKVWDVMSVTTHHVYQILTKRPKRMKSYLDQKLPDSLPNVWWGVSVEDQRQADHRIPILMETPAAVRFISAEPLLGPIDLQTAMGMGGHIYDSKQGYFVRLRNPLAASFVTRAVNARGTGPESDAAPIYFEDGSITDIGRLSEVMRGLGISAEEFAERMREFGDAITSGELVGDQPRVARHDLSQFIQREINKEELSRGWPTPVATKPSEVVPKKLDWVIIGGESGPSARDCDISWIQALATQCHRLKIPTFVKQLGSRSIIETEKLDLDQWGRGVKFQWWNSIANPDRYIVRFKDRKGGNPSEWMPSLRVREFPNLPA